MSHQAIVNVLWLMNFLIIGEAAFQLWPLIKGKPYASRRGCLVGLIKYLGALICNLLLYNWAMAVWLLIGLIKETVAYIILRDLKEGYKI